MRMGIIDYENFEAAQSEIWELVLFARSLRNLPPSANPYMAPWSLMDETEKMVGLSIAKHAGPEPEGEHLEYSWKWEFKANKKEKKAKKAKVAL